MQDRRAQRLIIDLINIVKSGEDRRDRHRVGDVGITAVAQLALMAPGRDVTGPLDQLGISARAQIQEDLAELREEDVRGACASAVESFMVIHPASSTNAGNRRCLPARTRPPAGPSCRLQRAVHTCWL